MYSPVTGKARLGYRPSKKSLKRMVERVHALTVRAATWQETTRLVDQLNPALRGWANPGFARWIEVTRPKGLEILAKTWIPTFTRCPSHFLRFRLGKAL